MYNIEQKLEFDKIKKILQANCISTLGKNKVQNIEFCKNPQIIEQLLKLTSEFVDILQIDTFPLEYLADINESLEKIRVIGTYLIEEELFALLKNLITFQKIINFFKKEENASRFVNWSNLAKKQTYYSTIVEIIKQVLSQDGQIKDTASANLRNIRTQIAEKQKSVVAIVKSTLSWAQKENLVDEQVSVTIRNGRMLIPIDAGKKNKIQGIVQDYSSTGKTLYIEPLKAVEFNNQLTSLHYEEKQEIIKILTQTTDKIRPYLDTIIENIEFLANIDFTRSKAIFAKQIAASLPQISPKPSLKINYAYHPILFLNNKKLNKKTIPLDIELNENQRIVLISGPNAGGKSIALKTVGLIQYMHQCGLLTPVKDNSIIGIFDSIFIDIGDEQSTENDLSTYTSHLFNLKNILQKSNKNSLVLLDELGAGTDPAMGGAIAEAILNQMLQIQLKAVVNTHYSNLKIFASQNQAIVNAAMMFDTNNLRPLYILEIGHPGSSFAFEIAQNIGLSSSIIDDAKNRAGKNVVDYDKVINQIEFEKSQISKEKNKLKEVKKQLEQNVIQYREEKQKLVVQKQKIIEQTKQLVEQLLIDANKVIEKTIKEIKENQAEKNQVKEIRKEFEKEKQRILHTLNKESHKINESSTKSKEKKLKQNNQAIEANDIVKLKDKEVSGKVLQIKDNKAILLIGDVKTIVDLHKIEKVGRENKKQKVNVNIQVENKPQFSIDLRGCKANEALEKLAKFIDTAIISDTKNLSVLHGTGDGILRNVIRNYLSNLIEVESFGDEDIRFGGHGITIIKLK